MGIFKKILNALKKTKDGISFKLKALFTGDKMGDEFYEELEDILISSDVSVKVALEAVENIRETAKEEKLKDGEYIRGLLKQSLCDMLIGVPKPDLKNPAIIMVIGVNGVGKTTSIGKMANLFTKQKKSVLIGAGDTFRAAASDQLEVWADRAKVRIIKHGEGSDPSAVVYDAVSSAKAKKTDVLIIDTAGRLHVKSNLMEELKKMDRVARREYPEANVYKLIVLDATTGQNALSQVDTFNKAVGIDGIILTKLDGTAKGGFVISLCAELKIPVFYVGVGEKIDDIEEFDINEFVEAIF